MVDCNPLKHAILSHCFDWHNRIGKLLIDNTAEELLRLHDKIHNQSALVALVRHGDSRFSKRCTQWNETA